VQGHEISAVVLELGSAYHGPLTIGERVAVEPTVPCGNCYACRTGSYNCCAHLEVMGAHIPGGLAEEFIVDPARIHPVGDLDPELAALVEPMSIGLQAVTRGRIGHGDHVLVLGAGPVGLAATIAAADTGARVVVADRISSRLDLAQRLGAERVILTPDQDLEHEAMRLFGEDGAPFIIDATGAPSLIRAAFDLVANAGTIVIVGISDDDVSIPVLTFTRKEVSVFGSRNSMGLFPEAIELVRRNRDRIRQLVTHRVPLDELPQQIVFAIEHPDQVEKMLVRVREAA
jgi:L-gulonate 5-dehydrogenase